MIETIRGKLKNVELAYIAGLIDGEGCIGIYSYPDGRGVSRLHILDVVITNNNPACYQFLKERFGGAVHERKYKAEFVNSNYQWRLRGIKAKDFLELIEPYLILKKQQAQLAIEFILEKKKYSVQGGSKFGHPLKIEEIEKREGYYLKMRQLNSQHNNRSRND